MGSKTQIGFLVPVGGVAVRCNLRLTRAGEVFGIAIDNVSDFRNIVREQLALSPVVEIVNALLHGGVPWGALASCRNSATLIGALIEAAEIRRAEVWGHA
jgi:hypothetical protein